MTWQPIETAPKDGTRFLGFWPPEEQDGGPCEIRTWWHDPALRWENPYESSDITVAPTHWMPLPESPE